MSDKVNLLFPHFVIVLTVWGVSVGIVGSRAEALHLLRARSVIFLITVSAADTLGNHLATAVAVRQVKQYPHL